MLECLGFIAGSGSCPRLPAGADPKALVVSQVVGFLSPTWETWIEFLASGVGLVQPPLFAGILELK